MTDGFVKLPRMLMTYPELKPHDAFYVLFVLLSLMRFRETSMDGVHVGVNQLLISKPELAERCNVNISRLKYILSVFEQAGGIKMVNNKNKNTIITVLDRYLPDGEEKTSAAPTGGERKKYKNVVGATQYLYCESLTKQPCVNELSEAAVVKSSSEAVKNAESMPLTGDEKKQYGEFSNVYLTDEEYKKLQQRTDLFKAWIDKLSAYMKSSGRHYDDHYATIIGWISEDKVNGRTGAGDAAKDTSNNFPECFKTPSYDLARVEERIRRNGPGPIKKRQR